MFNYELSRNSAITYWENQPTDRPYQLNGFNGTFAYSDHSLIPQPILAFLIEYFYDSIGEARRNHINKIPLDKINSCLNEIWEGPGSMIKLTHMLFDLRRNRTSTTPTNVDKLFKGYQTPTVDSNLGDNSVDIPKER